MKRSISIIIPTLNEEGFLAPTIDRITSAASGENELEIMVIDAGSTDKTVAIAQQKGVSVYEKPTFRLKKHESLNYGLQKANAEIVLFLDADTLLPQHFDRLVLDQLANFTFVGGGFNMQFDRSDWQLWILSRINKVRYTLWRTYYGDQAIFCRKNIALGVGGFPDTLMEAAYFCRKLKKKGKLALIKQPVISSSRRFYDNGILKVILFDLRMWFRFVLGLDVRQHRTNYWKVNVDNG